MPQLTVSVAQDSFMNAVSPDTNYNGGIFNQLGVLILGGSKSQLNRVVANFDVSAIPPGSTVQSAKMRRTILLVDATGHACTIYRCTRSSQWTDAGVTWNKYDGVTVWTAGGGDFDATTPAPVTYNEPLVTGEHEIAGLAAFVRDALEQRGGIVSIVMKNNDEAPSASQRSNWLSGAAWQLIIEYWPPDQGRQSFGGSRGGRRPVRARRAAAPATPSRPRRPMSR